MYYTASLHRAYTYYAPAAPLLIGGALSDGFVWRVTDVCLSHTSGLSRPRKTKVGTEAAYVTHNSGHHFQGQKVKGQGRQAALLSAALTHKAAAAVSVGTYSAWESTATLRLLGGARRGEERGGGILCRHAHTLLHSDS